MSQWYLTLLITLSALINGGSGTAISLRTEGDDTNRLLMSNGGASNVHCHKSKCGILCTSKKFSDETLCSPSKICDSSRACARAEAKRKQEGRWEWNGSARLAVLIFGQSARSSKRMSSNLCSKNARQVQLEAIKTQVALLEKLLSTENELSIDLFVATNGCGASTTKKKKDHLSLTSWASTMRESYGSLLRDASIANCDGQNLPTTRCFLRRGLEMLHKSSSSYAFVLMLRPDLHLRYPGQELVHDLLAVRGTSAWPFKCEPGAWNQWKCAADTIFSIAGDQFKLFEEYCLGADGCYAELFDASTMDNQTTEERELQYISKERESYGAPLNLKYSGHSCFRCMQKQVRVRKEEEASIASLAGSRTESARRPQAKQKQVRHDPVIVRDEERLVNARDTHGGGHNPYYFFAGG